MHTYDIIHEVHNGKLSDQQAAEFLDQIYENFNSGKLPMNPHEYLCMTYQELTALLMHGLYFTDIAKFRYDGWPNKCMLCSKNIIFGAGGTGFWTYRSQLIRGKLIKNALVCLKCADVLAGIFMKKKAIAFKKLHKKRKNKRRFVSK
jgi:hypothetical protein